MRSLLARALAAGVVAWTLAWPAPARSADVHVRFVRDVEQAKGHLLVSKELYARGQAGRASLHATHPVQELGNRLVGPIRKVDPELAERVRALLRQPDQAISRRVATPRYEALVNEVYGALDEAVVKVLPSGVRGSVTFEGQVLGALLEAAGEEYEEAVRGGTIAQVVEYQDAYGFVRRAQALHEQLESRARASVAADIGVLARAFPSVMPRGKPLPPSQVKALIERISAALEVD
jgi:hypothetical protein